MQEGSKNDKVLVAYKFETITFNTLYMLIEGIYVINDNHFNIKKTIYGIRRNKRKEILK